MGGEAKSSNAVVKGIVIVALFAVATLYAGHEVMLGASAHASGSSLHLLHQPKFSYHSPLLDLIIPSPPGSPPRRV